MGISRYIVKASNSEGEITSDVLTLAIETQAQAAARTMAPSRGGIAGTGPHIRTPEEIERQRQRLQTEEENKKPSRKWPLITLGIFFVGLAGGAIALLASGHEKSPVAKIERHNTNVALSNLAQSPSLGSKAMTNSTKSLDATAMPRVSFAGAETQAPEPSIPFAGNLTRLPAPWAARRIGNLLAATWASFNTNTFAVHGSGQLNDPQTDNFFFVQRPASNSVDFTSRIKSADQRNASRQGIMLRNSLRADAAFGFVGLSQQSILWMHRDFNSSPCKFMTVRVAPLPVYLRLVRHTNDIASAYSTDGSNWIWLGTNQVTFSQPEYLAGLAVSSGNAKPVEAVFDQVAIKNLKIE